MKGRSFLVALTSLLAHHFWDSQLVIASDEPLVPATFVPAKPPVTREGDLRVHYVGSVKEITKESITIEWPEEQPKKFIASNTLASGGYPILSHPRRPGRQPENVKEEFRYRLTDVKVGDRVQIYFSHIGGVEICEQICIGKRPGGRVPPLPEGAELLKTRTGIPLIPYHERQNAHWDLVDKGIPFPEKFGELRRWPAAPMPREKGLTGPLIRP